MRKIKKYLIILCTFFVNISFFFVYTPYVWGEVVDTIENEQIYDGSTNGDEGDVTFQSVEKTIDNVIVKATDGGVVTIVDNENSHVVEDGNFHYLYDIGTQLDIEITPNYNHYIESVVINGVEKANYDLDSIYELIPDIHVTDEVTTIEITFSEYADRLPLASGDTVKITKGIKYEYDGYYTNEYWIHADGYQFLGSCAEPVKEGPDGESFIATKITDPIFRYLMWCYQSEEFREEAFGAVEEEQQFILLHTTLGYYYCGEQGFGEMENSGKYWINKADAVLNWVRKVFYGSDEERYVKARTAARNTFDIYIAWGGDNYQDIVWIQPQDVDLTIKKRSETDLSDGSERYLIGAKFELYAWNGTSYAMKVATSVDNGDGTYTFQGINYMSATDGQFLVREVAAPTGYSKPYYFYNSDDSSDYSKYGGREFVLDKSYLEWSCDATEHDSDSLKGFTFYNSPEDKVVTLTKTDANTGEKLSGAVFELYANRNAGYTYKVGNFTDNNNGTYSINLSFDLAVKDTNAEYKYLVKETKAPNGYVIDSADKMIIFSNTGTLKNSAEDLIIENQAQNAKLQLKKASANSDITHNNSCYRLEGAEYTVYSDGDCTMAAGILKTTVDGSSNVLTLNTGTYYVKETKAPKGYRKDTQIYTVTLTSTHASATYVLEVEEKAVMNPVDVLLYKVDAETMQPNPQGFGTLSGAEFTVKYYAAEGTVDPAKDGKTPIRTWVFRTDKDGCVYYRRDYLVNGDELYADANGKAAIPLGIITIQETKASEGYLLNDTIYAVPITTDETTNNVSTYEIPTIPENILKFDLTKAEFGTGIAISGVVFEYTRPNGTKETLITDDNGKLSIKGLEYGTHIIKEQSVMEGYYVNRNEIKFSVDDNKKITVLSTAAVTDTNGNVTVFENTEGHVEAIVEDKFVPYSIQIIKTNDKGTVLAGAEFTLYSDEDCTQKVMSGTTDEKGLLKLTGLIYGNTYYLKETKAPQGYKLPEHVPTYKIKGESSPVNEIWNLFVNGKKYTITDTNSSDTVYLEGNASERILNIKMLNHIGLLLPETGSGMALICFVVGAALMISVFIFNKKKKVEN